MKNLLCGFMLFSSLSGLAGEKIQVEIKADNEELCQLAEKSVFKDVENILKDEVGAYVKYVTICLEGIDGKFRKTVKFVKP